MFEQCFSEDPYRGEVLGRVFLPRMASVSRSTSSCLNLLSQCLNQ